MAEFVPAPLSLREEPPGESEAELSQSLARTKTRSYGSTACVAAPLAERYVEHRLRAGDTLQGIALKYGVTVRPGRPRPRPGGAARPCPPRAPLLTQVLERHKGPETGRAGPRLRPSCPTGSRDQAKPPPLSSKETGVVFSIYRLPGLCWLGFAPLERVLSTLAPVPVSVLRWPMPDSTP